MTEKTRPPTPDIKCDKARRKTKGTSPYPGGEAKKTARDSTASATAATEVLKAQPQSAKSRAFFALKFVVSFALIAWIISNADLAAVADAIAKVDFNWFMLAILLQLTGPALMTLRWQRLLAVKGVDPGFGYLYNSTLVSTFFRQFLPSIIGGDALRGYDAWRAGADPSLAAVSLLVDRLLGLIALLIFALAAITIFTGVAARIPGIWIWVALGLTGLLAVVVLMFAPTKQLSAMAKRLRDYVPQGLLAKLDQIHSALRIYEGDKSLLAQTFAISILFQVNVVTFYWALSQALGLELAYPVFYAIVPLAIFVMLAPITINGIGLREAIFIYLLGLWAVGEPQALAFAWLEYGIFLGFGLLGGVIYTFRSK